MIAIIFFLMLLVVGLEQRAASDCSKGMVINHQLIKAIDGTARADIRKLLRLEKRLIALQSGATKDGVKKLIEYEKSNYTVQELVDLEATKKYNNKSLRKALVSAIKFLENASKDYLNENRGHKAQMVTLITQWARQRQRSNSQLLNWGDQPDGREYDHLKKATSTFKALDQFISDLLCFLRDMRVSCVKSWKHYQQSQKK